MAYDRGNSFPFDSESNKIHMFQNLNVSWHDDHILVNMKGKKNLFS